MKISEPISGPIYSPSRGGTQDFQRCPRLYDLSKRWEAWNSNEEIETGLEIHAALALFYSAYPMAEMGATSHACTREALKIDLLGTTGQVLAVEQEMGPERCHPDLVIKHHTDEHGEGEWLEVVDWKYSEMLKPEWVNKRLNSYETSWQLKHYAWRVQQIYGLPCRQTTIVQMAALPKPKAWRIDFPVTQEALDAWEKSARSTWNLMASGYNAQNYEGCRKYGESYLCPMYAGCHVLHSDESRFDTLYRRREGWEER